jgi:hypothetical protein
MKIENQDTLHGQSIEYSEPSPFDRYYRGRLCSTKNSNEKAGQKEVDHTSKKQTSQDESNAAHRIESDLCGRTREGARISQIR